MLHFSIITKTFVYCHKCKCGRTTEGTFSYFSYTNNYSLFSLFSIKVKIVHLISFKKLHCTKSSRQQVLFNYLFYLEKLDFWLIFVAQGNYVRFIECFCGCLPKIAFCFVESQTFVTFWRKFLVSFVVFDQHNLQKPFWPCKYYRAGEI